MRAYIGGRIIPYHPWHTGVNLLESHLPSPALRFGTSFAQIWEISEARGAALLLLEPY